MNVLFQFAQRDGLLVAAATCLLIESGFRAHHWGVHFSATMPAWLAYTVSIVAALALAMFALGLILRTAFEFATGAEKVAWIGAVFSVVLRVYIFAENAMIAGDVWEHTFVFLTTTSAIVALAEVRIALAAYSDARHSAQVVAVEAAQSERRTNRKAQAAKPKAAPIGNGSHDIESAIASATRQLQASGKRPTLALIAESMGVSVRHLYNLRNAQTSATA